MSGSKSLQEQLELINENISASTLTKYGYCYYELLSKLHLLLVKNKIRKAYYDDKTLINPEYFEDSHDIDSVIIKHMGPDAKIQLNSLRHLKQASSKMNLKSYEATHSYFYLNQNEIVPNHILDKFCRSRGFGRNIWVYDDPGIKNDIDDVIQGNIRIGDLLEYPKCCVDWLVETQTKSLIDCYCLSISTALAQLSDSATVGFLLDYYQTDHVPNNEETIQSIRKNHVRKTISKYPFVFHHACRSCLKNSNSPTAKLDQRYGRFARSISQEFYQQLVNESKKMVKDHDKL